ncbi:MAG: ABC transporter permease [Turicibacter sp.]|nr:ABC transporter permease [Turicibacter sp.]
MKRLWAKNLLLMMIVAVIGVFLSFSLVVRQITINLQEGVLERVAPIVTLGLKEEFWETSSGQDSLITWEMVHSIGSLPYIRTYNLYSFDHLLDFRNQEAIPMILENSNDEIADLLRERSEFSHLIPPSRDVTGIISPIPIEFTLGTLELSQGRFMTDEEVLRGDEFIVISELYAQSNGLNIGDTLSLESRIQDLGLDFPAEEFPDEELLFQRFVEFEIIGLFTVNEESLTVESLGDAFNIISLFNRFFTSHLLLEDIARGRLPALEKQHEWIREVSNDPTGDFPLSPEHPFPLDVAFALYDSRDLRDLERAAEEILPEGWRIISTDRAFSPVESAMNNMLLVSDYTLWLTAIASVFIVGLTTLLFIRDRRFEVGIYLGMGERKLKIIKQFLMELTVITGFGLALAMVISQFISPTITRNLLEMHAINELSVIREPFFHYPQSSFLGLYRSAPMTFEEIMEIGNTSLTTGTMGWIILIGMLLVAVSALLPILYLLKLDPKKILMVH